MTSIPDTVQAWRLLVSQLVVDQTPDNGQFRKKIPKTEDATGPPGVTLHQGYQTKEHKSLATDPNAGPVRVVLAARIPNCCL